MDYDAFVPESVFQTTKTAMDSDFLKDFFCQGYLLQATDGFSPFDVEPSLADALYDLPYMGSIHLGLASDHQEETENFIEHPAPPESDSSPVEEPSTEEESWVSHMIEAAEENCKFMYVSWQDLKEEPEQEINMKTHWDDNELDLYCKQMFSDSEEFGGDPAIDQRQRNGRKKKQTKPEKMVSLQVLRQYFSQSLKDAAKSIGVCPTTLKRICRQHGIKRWPSRKIKKVRHSLKKLQMVVDSVEWTKGLIEIGSFYTTIPEMNSQDFPGNVPVTSFTKSKLKPQPESTFLFRPALTYSKSNPSPDRQNSGLSFCFSASTNQLPKRFNVLKDSPVSVLKEESGIKALPGTVQNLQHVGAFRVKATFGEENIRFTLQPNWDFSALQNEIAKRFNIDDFNSIDLKYLDNDHDTVLLTCDADLDECKDLFSFSESKTIKMSLHQHSLPGSLSRREHYSIREPN